MCSLIHHSHTWEENYVRSIAKTYGGSFPYFKFDICLTGVNAQIFNPLGLIAGKCGRLFSPWMPELLLFFFPGFYTRAGASVL